MSEENGPDWAAIRHAVETTDEPIASIARRHGVPPQNVYARKSRWAWAYRIDTSNAMTMQRGLNRLVQQIFTQLKSVAAKSRAMKKKTKALASEPADAGTMQQRMAMAAEAETRLGRIMKLTADFTRLLDRAHQATAAERAAQDEYRESYEQFEGRLLGYIERIRAAGVPGAADAGGSAPPQP